MNTTQYMKIVKTGKEPKFNEMIGLKENADNASFLIDFVMSEHPNATKTAQGSKCEVRTERQTIVYTLYSNCIVRYNSTTSNRRMFTI